MTQTDNIWIIIPGYNEEKYIATVLKKVTKISNKIVFIDDGSLDKTSQIAKNHTEHVLKHIVNLGKGAALKTGCEYAFNRLHADAVIFMDSDDQHDPEEIIAFTNELKSGNDVVFGVRSFDTNMPLYKIALNRLASFYIYALFGTYVPDIPSGYKAISKKAYKKISWNSNDYAVEVEIATKVAKYKIPFSTLNIKTIYHDYDRGMTIIDVIKMLTKIVSWRLTL